MAAPMGTGACSSGAWTSGPALAPAPTDPATLGLQVQMEMLRELRRHRESDDEDAGTGGRRGPQVSACKGVRKLRTRWHRYPRRMVQEYEAGVMELLNISDPRQFWSHMDHSRRLMPTYAHMKGLWRCDHLFAEAIELSKRGATDHLAAYLCQCRKALLQVALDGGDWHHGALLVPTPDPLAQQAFGGEEYELEAIHAYSKALRELKGKNSQSTATTGAESTLNDDTAKNRAQRKREAAAAAKKKKEEAAAAAGAKQ